MRTRTTEMNAVEAWARQCSRAGMHPVKPVVLRIGSFYLRCVS